MDVCIYCEKIIIYFWFYLLINGLLINCSMSDGMKYNNYILFKVIFDFVNLYIRIELYNVLKVFFNFEIVLLIYIKKNE